MSLTETVRQILEGVPNLADPKPEEGKRAITSPPRGNDDLFIQPKEEGPKREAVEQHNRDRFAGHFNFADDYTGKPNSVDKKGNYNCGACNQEHKSYCLLLKSKGRQPLKVDEDAGSCEDWEVKNAGDAEMVLAEKTVESANYGVAQNGKGFGCHRCPFASKAFAKDSQGRELYCGKGDFRTYGYACCNLNGAPVK